MSSLIEFLIVSNNPQSPYRTDEFELAEGGPLDWMSSLIEFLIVSNNPQSPYRTDEFELAEGGPALWRRGERERPTRAEYVRVLSDVLCVNRNLCLCRHFHALDMAAVERRSPRLKFIDVWPVGPLHASREEAFSVRALFALQLAAVVRSARGWQHLRLRVHVPDGPPPGVVESGPDLRSRLEHLLTLLRIDATIHCVTDWPVLEDASRWDEDSEDSTIYSRVPLSYLQKVNGLMRARCAEGTAVAFVQLPRPPALPAQPSPADDQPCAHYLKVLDELTKDLCPTILVRGLKSVTSTAL
ncbi:unnamed protein product, partial [Iphiclides podalirius]